MLVKLQAYLAEEDLRIKCRVKAKNINYVSIITVQCIYVSNATNSRQQCVYLYKPKSKKTKKLCKPTETPYRSPNQTQQV